MCRPTDVLRSLVGITEYVPGPHPRARMRRPTKYGARSRDYVNGAGYPTAPSGDPFIENLVREHRLIRQILHDEARRRSRGQG